MFGCAAKERSTPSHGSRLFSCEHRAEQQFVGEVVEVDHQKNMITVEAKNRFEIGDSIEVMSPSGNQHITLEHMESDRGVSVEAAPGSGHIVRIALDTSLLSTKTLLLKEIRAPIHT